jgi:hypothetical protein
VRKEKSEDMNTNEQVSACFHQLLIPKSLPWSLILLIGGGGGAQGHQQLNILHPLFLLYLLRTYVNLPFWACPEHPLPFSSPTPLEARAKQWDLQPSLKCPAGCCGRGSHGQSLAFGPHTFSPSAGLPSLSRRNATTPSSC